MTSQTLTGESAISDASLMSSSSTPELIASSLLLDVPSGLNSSSKLKNVKRFNATGVYITDIKLEFRAR